MADAPTPEDLVIDIFAFRYALGRSSAAVPVVARRLRERWSLFSELQRAGVQRDIVEAVEAGCAGDPAYVAIWSEFLEMPVRDAEMATAAPRL